jgi:hypothetical protein
MQQNRILRIWEVCRGNLQKVSTDECDIIASIDGLSISLPCELLLALQPYIGCRIGILRTDITGKEYLIRVIQKKSIVDTEVQLYHEMESVASAFQAAATEMTTTHTTGEGIV